MSLSWDGLKNSSRGQDIYAACGLLSTSKKIGEIREHEDEEKMNK